MKRAQRRAGPVKREPEVTALLTEAGAHLDAGRSDEAEELCKDITARAPLDAEAFHMLAIIAYQDGRLEEAGNAILEAITRDDTDIAMHANCGAIMNMLGRAQEAEAACRHVIDLDPGHAEAHNNLTVALEVQGRADEALNVCAEALRLRPDYPEAHINQGNLRLRSGDLVGAVESYAAVLRTAPDNVMARANLGVALRELGEFDEAEDQCRSAIETNPAFPEAHNALGNVLVVTDRPGQAVECFRKAIELRSGYLEARVNLAAALFKSGDLAAAERAYRNTVAENEAFAEAHAGLGVVLLADGRLDEAIAAFRRAVSINPGLGEAQYNLAAAGIEFSEDELVNIRELSQADELPTHDRIAFRFALGEYADQHGQAAAAFEEFSAGNALRKLELEGNGQAFDVDAHDRDVLRIVSAFNSDAFDESSDEGNPTEVPVFIVGMPRSGTTLVEQIAASHPNVYGAGEIETLSGFSNADPTAAKGAEEKILTRFSLFPDAERVIDKTPFNFFYLGIIQKMFPNARLVHCHRDSLDTAVSCFFQNFTGNYPWSTDLRQIGCYMRAYERLMCHWREVLPSPPLEIQYEELVNDPEIHSRRLIDFLGLEWDDACLDFHQTRRPVLSASNWQVRKPLYDTSVGRAVAYQSYLKPLLDGLGI